MTSSPGPDFGTDVVEEDPGKPVPRDRPEDERNKPPAGGADDRDPVEPEMVKEFHYILSLAAGVVVHEVRVPVRPEPPAEGQADQVVASAQRAGKIIEVALVAREPGQA